MKQRLFSLSFIFLLVLAISFFSLYRSWRQQANNRSLFSPLENQTKQLPSKAPSISPQEVYQAIRQPTILLVDIRPASEFTQKHIEASINIPLAEIKNNLRQFSPNKKIIIIDRQDSAEGKILVNHLRQNGLESAYLKGGILQYAQEGYPLIAVGNLNNPADLMKVETLSAAAVKEKLLQGQVLAFIDTRSVYAFHDDHIPGSLNFPLESLEKQKEKLPAKTLLLYDDNPERSWQAGVRLYDMGLSNFFVCSDNYQQLKQTLFNKDAPVGNTSK